MKYEWSRRPLGEIASFVSGGTPSKNNPNYWGGTIPWVSAKTMKGTKISTSDLFITEEGLAKGSKLAPQGSILLLTRGSGLFNGLPLCFVESPVAFNQDVKCIRSKTEISNKYIFYWLMSQKKFLMAKVGVTGIGAGKFDTDFLANLEVPIPNKAERDAIVEITDNITDKISINEHINDNLQQQLLAVFDKLVTAHEICESVELKTLCAFQEGYVNPPQTHPEYFDGSVKWLRAVDINESFIIETSRTLTTCGFESAKKSALLFQPNTIAISKSGTIGRLGIISDFMCGNRAVINIRPLNPTQLPLIYAFLKSKQREFPDLAVGSVQKNLYVSLLEPLQVELPDAELVSQFCDIGNRLLKQMQTNCKENLALANLRDALLPQLMTGKIDVSDIQP